MKYNIIVIIIIGLILGLVIWVAGCMEAMTYNKLTGAHVTTWDALWVDLRVQDSPKKGDQ